MVNDTQDMSRRGFVGAAAGLAAGACALSTVAKAAEASAANEAGESWDEEFDVVIAGAGIAGLASAVTVAQEGEGATCLLLEKGEEPDGLSKYSEGGIQYTEHPEEYKTYVNALMDGVTPQDVIDAYVDGLTENVSWVEGLGLSADQLTLKDFDENSFGEYPEIENDQYAMMFMVKDGTFDHIHPFLLNWVQSNPDLVEYRPGTAFEELVQDASGAVTGVVAGGRRIRARKGVIMCTGGIEHDPEMIRAYSGVKNVHALAGSLNTADGHRACMKAGADMWHMSGGAQFWLACRDLADTRFISPSPFYSNKQYGITVGVNGRHFYMDVDGCLVRKIRGWKDVEEFGRKGEEHLSLDTGYRHGITQYGGEWHHLPLPAKAWFVCDADGLAAGGMDPDISSDVVADGWAYATDTIEELAKKIGVPADELSQTVDVWNRYCDQGFDEAFYRPASLMTKVETGPFYAMMCVPTILNSDGGPRRDAAGRICDPYGKPIEGLYSAGEFGSIWGDMYNGGSNIAECCVFGRIAARSALSR